MVKKNYLNIVILTACFCFLLFSYCVHFCFLLLSFRAHAAETKEIYTYLYLDGYSYAINDEFELQKVKALLEKIRSVDGEEAAKAYIKAMETGDYGPFYELVGDKTTTSNRKDYMDYDTGMTVAQTVENAIYGTTVSKYRNDAEVAGYVITSAADVTAYEVAIIEGDVKGPRENVVNSLGNNYYEKKEDFTVSSADYDGYAAADLNLRAGAGKAWEKVGGISYCEHVHVTGIVDEEWVRVMRDDGQEGYTQKKYIVNDPKNTSVPYIDTDDLADLNPVDKNAQVQYPVTKAQTKTEIKTSQQTVTQLAEEPADTTNTAIKEADNNLPVIICVSGGILLIAIITIFVIRKKQKSNLK